MRILIDPGGYFCDHNLGDLAMLQVACERLRKAWPEAQIGVVTHSPRELRERCPGTMPVHGTSRQAWWINEFRSLQPPRFVPSGLTPRLMLLENAARARFGNGRSGTDQRPSADESAATPFLDALDAADLFVVSGQGGLNDEFVEHSTGTLLALDRAVRLHKPTVMLSQGIGPITNPKLNGLARLVLPRVDLIFLREGLSGPGLLKSLGCRTERIVITGDDAIAMAVRAERSVAVSTPVPAGSGEAGDHPTERESWREAESGLGDAVGVNARLTYYSAVTNEDLKPLKEAVQEFGAELRAPLLGLPIWRPGNEGDLAAIRALISDYDGEANAGEALDSPEKLIAQARHCRIVITGSYHAAVFALALGIPVVALSNSPYYDWKFKGLVKQFGGGLVLIPVRESAFKTQLIAAARELWNPATELKPALLEAARKQQEAARAAFSRVQDLVASRG